MEDKNNITVPYIMVESMSARFERVIKRLLIALIISVLLNVVWIFAWMQYDYVGTDVDVDSTDGIANYIGGSGGIINGTSKGTD